MRIMKKNNEEFIYVVLVKAHTALGRLSRKLCKYEYTHISICLDDSLTEFITFSRRNHYSPFDSGYMVETLDCYAYGSHKKVKLKVFKVPLSEQHKHLITKYIENIANDNDYLFNIYSMVTMPLLHGFRIYKTHNCMSFAAKILEMSKAVKMSKCYYKYNINDIDKLLSQYSFQEKYFYKESTKTINYMSKKSFFSNVLMFFGLNFKLIYRIITKRVLIRD